MKRFISLIAALVITLACVCGAAAEAPVFKTKYFTLTLPNDWEIDTDTSDAEQEEGEEFLGFFYGPAAKDLVVEAYLVYYEDLKDLALWNSDEAELQAYIDAIMEDYADDNPEYLGVVTAGIIPFVLIKATDEEGEYLYADTMTNGYAIEMMAYVTDYKAEKSYPLTDAFIEQFKAILATFQPVTGE